MISRTRVQPQALLALVLLAVAVGMEAPTSSQEASVDGCVKATGEDMQYICNDGEYNITGISFKAVIIKCKDTKLNCSRFPSIDFENNSMLETLNMVNCTLEEPISCYLAKLHVADVEQLYLNKLLMPLTARHFEGLQATTSLNIFDRDSPKVQKSNLYGTIASLPHLKKVLIDGTQLTLAPGLLQAPSVQVLELRSDSISELPPGSFGGLPSLDSLTLKQMRIEDINNGTFVGLVNVRFLSLIQNRISEVRGGALTPLLSLEELSIKDNPLRRLHDGFLQGLDHLKKVTLSNSGPLVLDPQAFADLRFLRYVVLHNCGLRELPSTFLRGSKAIQTLTFMNNRLEGLHPEVFRDQTEMTQLDLSLNLLKNITGDVFTTLKKLEKLDLSDNLLQILPDALFSALTSLRVLSVSHNFLRQISPMAFQNAPLRDMISNWLSYAAKFRVMSWTLDSRAIEKLDMSYNLIEDIYDKRMLVMPRLRLLDLSHNRISRLPYPNFFLTSVVNVAKVDLSFNNISTVDLNPETFSMQRTPVKYVLDHNPFNCDCHIYSFVKFATSYTYSEYFSIWNAQCDAPVRLKGNDLDQVPWDEFKCQLKCPSVCNCTDVPSKDVVEAVCSEDTNEPSQITSDVSLRFTRKPKTLRHFSFKNVIKIDLSALQLNEIDFETLPETVKVLNLSDNNLNYLPKDIFKRDISFALGNNPLFCDCSNQEHVAELQQNSANILDYPVLSCKDDILLAQVDVKRICDMWKFTIIGVSLTVLLVVCLLFAVVLYRYSFEVKIYISKYFPYLLPEEKYDASKKYDVFISYAHQDEDFVRDTLLPKLEGPSINVKTCIHSRDWIVGEMIPYNIAKSVEESRRTMIVLSENFLKSIWALLEFRAAHVQAAREGKTRVVVILLEDVMNSEDLDKEIKAYLHMNTYIKWGEPWFWEKLTHALPKRGNKVDRREEKRLQSIANELAKTGLEVQLNNRT